MSQIHIILHCLPREIDDLERIVKVMLPTFRKFLNIDDLHKFYIISPKKDLEIIEKRLDK